jgi:hypothetical protein
MQGRNLNREERERAEALNADISQLKTLHDDCLYGLRYYFYESHALLKYLELKTDCAYNEDCFYFYFHFIHTLKELTQEMQLCVTESQRLETKLHQFCMQYNRLLKHLESSGSRQERAAIFLEMEMETGALLSQFIRLAQTVEAAKIDFKYLKKEAEVVEAN